MLSKPTAYEKWLGIKSQDQPPTLYRLLGVEALESDADIISHAADSRMTYLRQFQTGPNAQLAEEILGEVSHARVVLLNPDQKSTYDQRLRQKMLAQGSVASGTTAPSLPPAARPLDAGLPIVPPRTVVHPAGIGIPVASPLVPRAANSSSLDIASLVSESQLTTARKPSQQKKASLLPWIGLAGGVGVVVLLVVRMTLFSGGEESSPASTPTTTPVSTQTASAPNTAATQLVFDWAESERDGATLEIDGASYSVPKEGPVIQPVEAGSHKVVLRRRGYTTIELTVSLEKNDERRIKPDWMPTSEAREPARTAATTISSGSPAVPSIPPDAQAFGGNHYKFIRGNVGWHDAKRQCENLGGHLVIINNDGEQDFVNSLIRNADGYVYLGLTNEETQGEWRWIDGRKLTFAKWYPGEPNNAGSVEHWGCINTSHGLWLDIAKTHPKVVGFVCQWDGKASSSPSKSSVTPPVANGDRRPSGWVVVFRSADPSIWNTDTQRGENDFAKLLSTAPPQVARLRMRRIDTGEGIILPMQDQQLDVNNFTTNDRLDFGMANGRMVWYGENSKKKGAYHIGIIDPNSLIQSGQGMLAVPIWGRAYKCWGFGHAHLAAEQQLCGWAGQPLSPTVFEIAVSSSSGTESSVASDDATPPKKEQPENPFAVDGVAPPKKEQPENPFAGDGAAAPKGGQPQKSLTKGEIQQADIAVNDLFKDDIANARTPEQKVALVEKLLTTAKAEDNRGNRYALLKKAAEIAASIGNTKLTLESLNSLDEVPFSPSVWQETLGVLATKHPEDIGDVFEKVDALVQKCYDSDDYDSATKLAELLPTFARIAKSLDLLNRAKAKAAETAGVNDDFKKHVVAARAVLEKNPTDADANLVMGKFLCFVRKDWDRGLPMLALGSDKSLQALAILERKEEKTPEEMVSLGDQWKAAGHKDRTLFWYNQAIPNVSGIVKVRLEKQLAAATAEKKDKKRVELLVSTDPAMYTREGLWQKQSDAIASNASDRISKLICPTAITSDSYELQIEFARMTPPGENQVVLMFPVKDRAVNVLLSGDRDGRFYGMEEIDGKIASRNSTGVNLPPLRTGQRYVARVVVKTKGDDAMIGIYLAQQRIIAWSGKLQSLRQTGLWSLPDPTKPAVGSMNATVNFYSMKLTQ